MQNSIHVAYAFEGHYDDRINKNKYPTQNYIPP